MLLDDFILLIATGVGCIAAVGRASIAGTAVTRVPLAGILFGGLCLYKIIDLGILSLFYPWTDLAGIGSGVLVSEGVLVIGKTSVFFAVYLLVYNAVTDTRLAVTTLRIFVVCVAVVVIVGILQFLLLGHPVITSTFRNVYVLGQIVPGYWGVEDPWLSKTAAGHEHLGAFMILSLTVVLGLLMHEWPPRKLRRHLMWLLCAGCLFTLIFASSRGAWIGGVCAIFVFSWRMFKFRKGKRVLFAGLIALALVGMSEWYHGVDTVSYVEQRIEGLAGVMSGDLRDDSGEKRMALLTWLWEIFLDKPIVGWGPGGAGRIAEGQFIREMVEGGVIGTFIFLLLLISVYRPVKRLYLRTGDPFVKGLSVGLACGLVGIMAQSMFTEILIVTKVATPLWILAATVHALYTNEVSGLRAI